MVLGRRELCAILLAVAALVFYLALLSTTASEAQTNGITTNLTGVTRNQVPVTNLTGDTKQPGNRGGANARAGGASASANSGRKPQQEKSIVNIPNRPLPPSGGLPVYGVVAGCTLAGASLLALGLVIRRGSRG